MLVRDVRECLPRGWADDIKQVSWQFGRELALTGDDPTSRHIDDRNGKSVYRVTTYGDIVERLPWLDDLYFGAFHDAALEVDDQARCLDDDSAININECSPGCGYEWHVDPNSPTGLLFVTADTTGRFLMQLRDYELDVQPIPGLLLMFDARQAPHCVLPASGLRISVPMVYLGAGQERSADNDYLYGSD